MLALAVAAAGLVSCGSPSTVAISAPANGTHVAGNVVTLHLDASGLSLAAANGQSSSGTGHYVVFVDGTPPAAGNPMTLGATVLSSASGDVPVSGLVVGRHSFTAVLADGVEKRVGSSSATVEVTVDGPAVTARVVGAATTGSAYSLALSSYGVTIADIPADISGKTAHYAVLVDTAMPSPGVVLYPRPGLVTSTGSLVPMAALTPGGHVIWVVLVNGQGRTLSPLVAAEVSLTVH